jgi:hypothetical protein
MYHNSIHLIIDDYVDAQIPIKPTNTITFKTDFCIKGGDVLWLCEDVTHAHTLPFPQWLHHFY